MSIFRILFSTYLLVFKIPVFYWVGLNPDLFLDPPAYSIPSALGFFPHVSIFFCIDILIISLICCLLFGYKTTISSILISILLVIGYSFKYSFGKIDHSIIWVLTPLCLSFSGWQNYYSIDSKQSFFPTKKTDNSTSLYLLAMFIAIGFFSSGYAKFPSWFDLDLSHHGSRAWVLSAKYFWGKNAPLLDLISRIDNPLIWEFFDYSVLLFECSFLIALINIRVFRIYIFSAALFHVFNTFTLYIIFNSQLLVYLVFTNWKKMPNIDFSFLNSFTKIKFLAGSIICFISFYIWAINFCSEFIISSGELPSLQLFLSLFTESYSEISNYLFILISIAFLTIVTFQFVKHRYN